MFGWLGPCQRRQARIEQGLQARLSGDAVFGGSILVLKSEYAHPVLAQMISTDLMMQIFPFVLIFAIMYFLILRPQQQRLKAQQEMLKNIRRGDTIVLGGGLIGKVTKVTEGNDELEAEIATGVKVRVSRALISEVRVKGEPVSDAAKA
jgi:preprotein translocase subunit YajC